MVGFFWCACVCSDVGFLGVSRSLAPALPRVLLNSPHAMLTHVPVAPQPRATAPPCCLHNSRRCGDSGRLRAAGYTGPGHEGTASGLRRCPGGLRGTEGGRNGGQRGGVTESATLTFITNLEMIFFIIFIVLFSPSPRHSRRRSSRLVFVFISDGRLAARTPVWISTSQRLLRQFLI